VSTYSSGSILPRFAPGVGVLTTSPVGSSTEGFPNRHAERVEPRETIVKVLDDETLEAGSAPRDVLAGRRDGVVRPDETRREPQRSAGASALFDEEESAPRRVARTAAERPAIPAPTITRSARSGVGVMARLGRPGGSLLCRRGVGLK